MKTTKAQRVVEGWKGWLAVYHVPPPREIWVPEYSFVFRDWIARRRIAITKQKPSIWTNMSVPKSITTTLADCVLDGAWCPLPYRGSCGSFVL